MSHVNDLIKRFPYMFSGRNIGLDVAEGWGEVFTKLCEDIDTLLGDDKRGFHWLQLKEKFGSARFYHQHDSGDDEVYWKLDELIGTAEDKTSSMCYYCGQPGEADTQLGWVLVLCKEHAAARKVAAP